MQTIEQTISINCHFVVGVWDNGKTILITVNGSVMMASVSYYDWKLGSLITQFPENWKKGVSFSNGKSSQ